MKLDWDSLNPPCRICRDIERPTTGVAYSNPEEVRFFCREHLPDEFDERKIKSQNRRRKR